MTNLIEHFTDEELRGEMARRSRIRNFRLEVEMLQARFTELLVDADDLEESFILRDLYEEVVFKHGGENERARGV